MYVKNLKRFELIKNRYNWRNLAVETKITSFTKSRSRNYEKCLFNDTQRARARLFDF